MDSISLIRTPIEAELGDFKELFDSSLSSSNALLDSVVSHIRQRNAFELERELSKSSLKSLSSASIGVLMSEMLSINYTI